MEDWQRCVITNNLPKLTRETKCNTALLVILLAKDVISTEEMIQIDIIEDPVDKAGFLYDIITTRKKSYDEFLKACRQVKKFSIVGILEDGEKEHNLSAALQECIISEFNPPSENIASVSSFDSISKAISDYADIREFRAAFSSLSSSQLENELGLLRGPENETLLHVAAAHGYIQVIEYLLELGVDIFTTDGKGRTPGHFIGKFSTNLLETLTTLVQHGLDVRQVDNDGLTIATAVIRHGRINRYHYHHLVNYMITNGYEDLFTQKSKDGFLPLHHALEMLDLEKDTVDLILKSAKININQLDDLGRTFVHWALMQGRSLVTVQRLIDLGGDYQIKDKSKEGVLHFAVQGGNKEVISFLLSLKMDINEVNELGEAPLHKVVLTTSKDYLGMVKLLSDNGANICAKNKFGSTLAHLIACDENIPSNDFQTWVKGMIDYGHSNIFATICEGGRTPLQSAIWRLDVETSLIKLMLESSKVDINQPDLFGQTLLHYAIYYGRSTQTIQNLLDLGANIRRRDKNGNGVFHFAVNAGNKDVLKFLISQDGCSVHEKNKDRCTPLHVVYQTRAKNYFELTKWFLDHGEDLYSKNKDGNTLAHLMPQAVNISSDEYKSWVTAVIEGGHTALFTIRGQLSRTPLHAAMEKLDVDLDTMMLIVVSAKLDIHQVDQQGNDVLHLALMFGRSLDTIKNLLRLGADWKRKGMQGSSVLHSAVKGSNKEAVVYFKSLGADVNATDTMGQTPLHYMVLIKSKDYLGMSKTLLENGANLNAKDYFGKTVDHYMTSNKDISAEEYGVWKEGMIQLGHGSFFQEKSLLSRLFSFGVGK